MRRRVRRRHRRPSLPLGDRPRTSGSHQSSAPRGLRLRSQHGRRRRHSDPDAAPLPAQSGGAAGIDVPEAGGYGAGAIFLPTERPARDRIREVFQRIVSEEGQTLLGWRPVPVEDCHLGSAAATTRPVIEQIFIAASPALREATAIDPLAFERKLYVIRKRVEHAVDDLPAAERQRFYIPSLSSRTLIYKGMLTAAQIQPTFPDLGDPDIESALALVHQRFSTNTFPSWPLAHPYRFIAHNGEINTLRGNINWMQAREGLLASPLFGDDLRKLLPIIREGGSDTATFDNVLELLVMAGRSLPHALLMMIPEPWSGNPGDGSGAARLLRVPRVADGALGRPGVDRFHGRHRGRRRARPERPAAVAVLRHARRSGRDGVGSRRARHRARGDCFQGARPARPHLPGRHRARPHRVRRGDEARAGGRTSVRRLGAWQRWSTSTSCRPPPTCRDPATKRSRSGSACSATPTKILAPADADGAERRRAHRIDGHRRRPCGVVGPFARALRLFQADVRTGDEPAARRDPRADGHDHVVDRRAGGQPARSAAGVLPADHDRLSGDRQRAARAAAPRLPARVPLDHAGDGVRRRRAAARGSRAGSRS